MRSLFTNVGLAIGLGALAVAGLAAGAAPNGRQVDVDGHAMYIECHGHGSPAVVLDAGLGDSSVVWSRVAPSLSRFTRVCSYDRAGYGKSAASLLQRTSAVIVDELHTLLRNAEVEPPYVLVGHSFGGWNMQLFASTYPKTVAGLVLVDSSQVPEIERYQQELGIQIAPKAGTHMLIAPYVPPDLPPSEAKRARALAHDPKTWHTTYEEWQGFRISEHQVEGAPPLPDTPLLVLSRGRPIVDPHSNKGQQERLWRTLQREFVARHPGSVLLVAHRSGHYIQIEQPRLVVGGICRVLQLSEKPMPACPPIGAAIALGD